MGRRGLQSKHAIKAAKDFAELMGVDADSPRAQAISALTTNELQVLTHVLRDKMSLSEATKMVYKTPERQKVSFLLSNKYFTNAFCSWLEARDFSPDMVLDFVIELLHAETPKFLYNHKKEQYEERKVPDYSTRVAAAKMLLDRIYYPEKKVHIEKFSLSAKLGEGDVNVNTQRIIDQLKMIESRIKQIDSETEKQIIDAEFKQLDSPDVNWQQTAPQQEPQSAPQGDQQSKVGSKMIVETTIEQPATEQAAQTETQPVAEPVTQNEQQPISEAPLIDNVISNN